MLFVICHWVRVIKVVMYSTVTRFSTSGALCSNGDGDFTVRLNLQFTPLHRPYNDKQL